jgi:hypothetical protein
MDHEDDEIATRAYKIWEEISQDSLVAVGITCCLAKACLQSAHPNDVEFIRALLSSADLDGRGATKH